MRIPEPKEFRHLVGVPFISGGRNPAIGLDCWGLFMLVQKKFGHDVPDVDVLCTEILNINRTARKQMKELWEPVQGPEPGLAVVMATDHEHPEILQHFGVLLDTRQVIHCLQNTGVVVDRLDVLQGALCIKGFYRWTGPATIKTCGNQG